MAEPVNLDLNLHLLDRQVITTDGRILCKVDDVEFELDATGHPVVTAILVGPRALAPRLRGRLGRWTASIAARLAGSTPDAPPRIDFAAVTDIGSAVVVATPHRLAVTPLEEWVDHYVVAPIPGSRDAG